MVVIVIGGMMLLTMGISGRKVYLICTATSCTVGDTARAVVYGATSLLLAAAFMLMFGIVWVSLMWMYFTEVRPLSAVENRKSPESVHFL